MPFPRSPDAPGRAIPLVTRRLILPDGAVILCRFCALANATGIDHVYPWAQGGSHDVDNLVPACTVCNSIAGIRVFGFLGEKITYVRMRREELGNDVLVAAYRALEAGERMELE